MICIHRIRVYWTRSHSLCVYYIISFFMLLFTFSCSPFSLQLLCDRTRRIKFVLVSHIARRATLPFYQSVYVQDKMILPGSFAVAAAIFGLFVWICSAPFLGNLFACVSQQLAEIVHYNNCALQTPPPPFRDSFAWYSTALLLLLPEHWRCQIVGKRCRKMKQFECNNIRIITCTARGGEM